MTLPRFSLNAFLVTTAYIAVVVGAVVAGTYEWADTVFTISLGVILVATLAAVFLSSASRTFWRGFCLIAWIYMFLVFGPMADELRQHLVTDRALKVCQRVLAPIQAAKYVRPGFELQQVGENRYRTGPRSNFDIWGGSWEALQRTGHSVWAILLGLVGGYLAVVFSGRGGSRQSA